MQPPSQQQVKIGTIDVEAFSRNLARLIENGGRALSAYLKPREQGEDDREMADEVAEVVKTLGHVAEYWLADPQRAVELQTRLGKAYLDLWAAGAKRLAGEATSPVAAPASTDKRFADPEWSSNQFYDFLKQGYLLTTQWANQLVSDASGLDAHTRQKAEFYVRQISNALSPSNFILTNPELLRETLSSNADNLVRGMKMLAEDIEAGGGHLRIRQSDSSMFEVGRNLATTPGKVIFQNDLMQLVQYAPSTPTVLKRPLLIVPPWINKFYVLDLTPEKSFIKWCVDRGVTVFCISWVNPDAHLAQKTFEDYVREGAIAALDVIQKVTGEDRVHTIGYCVGGTLLSVTLAAMAAWRDQRIMSATLFAAQVDFTYAGDLKVFVDEAQVEALEQRMAERGYLEGRKMATVFNLMRSNDLIWPYVVNNYLKGKAPFPFDLLYWNSDATRMPGRQPCLLCALLLSGKQAGARQDDNQQYGDRPQVRQGANLQSGDARRPYRAAEIGAARKQVFRRPGALCAGRVRPYCRRRQPARPQQIPILDRTAAAQRRSRQVARQGHRASGVMVAGLACLAEGPGRDRSTGARTRRRRAHADRGRAGKLM